MSIPIEPKITLIPIDDIHILNPRVRNHRTFLDITNNMENVGMKRPITVIKNTTSNTERPYTLVCGQGRLEAFQTHKQESIPAIIIDASEKEALIMSLVENLARHKPHPLDLLHGIKVLREKYDATVIAQKIGMEKRKVYVMFNLLDKGEERLLAAVESGQIPVSVAADIARCPQDEQRILQEAYEKNELRGANLKIARRLLEKRNQFKKKNYPLLRHRTQNSRQAVKILQKEIDKKQLMTRKANIASSRMTFIVEALRRLLSNDHFNTLLKAEQLNSLPNPINTLIEERNKNVNTK